MPWIHLSTGPRSLALITALTYAIVSLLWIFWSDHVLATWSLSAPALTELQTLKGWFFVGCTSVMLYSLIQMGLRRLQYQHQLLLGIINSTPDLILVKDTQGHVLVTNQAAVATLGRRMTSSPPHQLTPETERSPDIEEMRLEEGKPRWFLTTRRLCLNGRSRPLGVVEISRDITSYKQAENALRENEERLRLALTAAKQGLYDVNLQTGNVIVNSTYALMLGYDPADFSESTEQWIKRLHPEDRNAAVKRYEAYATGELPEYAAEFRLKTRSGDWIWVLSLGKIIAWEESGRPLRMLGTHTDISDRKRAEAELRRRELLQTELKLVETIFEVILAGYWDWDIPGHQEYLSPTFKRMFGYADHELSNSPDTWQRLIFPEDLPSVMERFERHVQTRGEFPFYNEVRYRHKDGSTVWVICSGRVIEWDEAGNPLRAIGCHIDITDRKRAETQLKQTNDQLARANAELARATRLKDEFLANMSHELRTPLTSILGMSEILKDEIYGPLNPKQAQYVDIIAQSGQHLLTLINDILDLAKIESGQMQLEVTPTSVQQLCEASLSFVQQLAHNKDISLETYIDPDLDEIEVDEIRMRQALINLLSNAVKFTLAGGQVTLRVMGDRPHQQIQFSIIDTGIGIAPEHLPRLFKSFVQIDSSLSRQYAGTGLGLALVKQIAEMHQGTVAVESTVGQGSCFTLTLPHYSLRTPESASGPTAADPGAAAAGCTTTVKPNGFPLVLLVDDDPASIATFSNYLTHHDLRLLTAYNGHDALALAQEHHPDLILMDIQLPTLDGLNVIRQMRILPHLTQIPILALTALAMAGDRETCLAAGATEYFPKPGSLKQLLALMQRLLQAP